MNIRLIYQRTVIYCGMFLFISTSYSTKSFSYENPIFGYTHLLPSPFTLPAGKVMFGTSTGIGITDFLDVQTNIISDFYKIYNGTARATLLDFPGFAAGVYVGYQYVNLNDISQYNPSIGVSSWMPGGVLGMEIIPDVALFFGGNFFYSPTDIPGSTRTAGFLQGAQIESDLSWAYNPHGNSTGNVLSGGVTYNSTFNIYGFGVSHHWRGFHLGLHYYPNATYLNVLPIVSGGAVVDL